MSLSKKECLSIKERVLLAWLLRRASHKMGRVILCDEVSVVVAADYTLDDCADLWKKLAAWDDPDLIDRKGEIFKDWYLMRYFADRLLEGD